MKVHFRGFSLVYGLMIIPDAMVYLYVPYSSMMFLFGNAVVI